MSAAATHDRRLPDTDVRERQILHRVDRAVKVAERELRYQLDRKDHHPLAQADELLDVLANLEDLGRGRAARGWPSSAPTRRECRDGVD